MSRAIFEKEKVNFIIYQNINNFMKGISPIVAAVLLIAVTMTIAGILAYWSASFVEKGLPTNETQCSLARFVVDTCSYNTTSNKITLRLDNRRNVDLSNLKAFIYYANGTVSAAIPLNETLAGNTIKSFVISQTENFAQIVVKTQCPDVTANSTCTIVT